MFVLSMNLCFQTERVVKTMLHAIICPPLLSRISRKTALQNFALHDIRYSKLAKLILTTARIDDLIDFTKSLED